MACLSVQVSMEEPSTDATQLKVDWHSIGRMTLYWQFEVGLAKVAKCAIGTGLAPDWPIGTGLTDWHWIGTGLADWHRIGTGLADWHRIG